VVISVSRVSGVISMSGLSVVNIEIKVIRLGLSRFLRNNPNLVTLITLITVITLIILIADLPPPLSAKPRSLPQPTAAAEPGSIETVRVPIETVRVPTGTVRVPTGTVRVPIETVRVPVEIVIAWQGG
jgi:hypothetical protein